jgi:predicted enzyme related to lactoylglutathione lyase
MLNALAWFEIPATDIARARRFYETIFQFEMRPLDLGTLQMALFPAEGSGGALCQMPAWYKPSAEAGPLVYLNAEPDLAIVLGRVEGAGGKVTVPKRQISPEYGYMAVFIDCEGNRVALHSMK